MVPVQALEASTLTFVGHNWGRWRAHVGRGVERAKATMKDVAGKPFPRPRPKQRFDLAFRHCPPSHHLSGNSLRLRSDHLRRSIYPWHAEFCILPLAIRGSSSSHPDNVEGERYLSFQPRLDLSSTNADYQADCRLVLHLLRPRLPSWGHPPRRRSAVVSLPILRGQHAVGHALGNRGDGGSI